MPGFNSDVVKEGDLFAEDRYPDVARELEAIRIGMAPMDARVKSDMVISFLKDHGLRKEWVEAAPEISRRLTARAFPTAHTEALFASGHGHQPFLAGLEALIRDRMSAL